MCFPMRDLAPPYAIQYAVTGEGALSLPALRAAVAAASARHPGARLTRAGREWVDSGVAPRVRVVGGHRLGDAVLDHDPVAHGPIGGASPVTVDARAAEATVEVVVMTESPVTLLFRAFHGVMDGAGLGVWMSDVFRALRGEEPIGAPDPMTDEEFVARLGGGGSPTRLVPSFRSPVGHGVPARGEPGYLTRTRHVDAPPGAVVARLAASIAARGDSTARFMIPVDLRRHDGAVRSTANLSLPLFLDVDPGRQWWEVNARLLTGLLECAELSEMSSSGLATAPEFVSRAVQRGMRALGARAGRNLVTALISHIGRFALADLSGAGFTARSLRVIPVHTMMIPFGVFLVETEAGLSIAVSARNGPGVSERVETLLDELVSELATDRHGPAREEGPASPVEHPRPALVGPPSAAAPAATAVTLFLEQVEAAPDAVAVRSPETSLTYRELADRAEAVAAELIRRGVRGSGEVVAVLAGRTPHAVVAQWGVLFAGAAFLPLDPAHPTSRLRDVVRRAGVRHCLVEREHVERADGAAEVVTIEDIPVSATDAIPAAGLGATPGDVAYVTYTSGSTGAPKGVEVTHRGIANWAESAHEWYRLGPGRAFCHHHTPAADLACIAFFGAHLSGSSLVLVPGGPDPLSIRWMLTESGADTVLLTPSLARMVVEMDFVPAPLHALIFAGEQLDHRLAAAARRFFGVDTLLVNSYGPAELTLVCTNHTVAQNVPDIAEPVPIGRPSVATPVYLLDAEGAPVGPGQLGELYIGGPQVARGYLGAAAATRERFVLLGDGVRVYRTGDLALLRPDGELVFAGRVDDQIKIRGYRIEPEEVRIAVEGHPRIARAAVVAHRRTGTNTDALAAFVVLADDPGEDGFGVAELREFLADRLPAHMIPTLVRCVADLPRNGNGKLDRQALVVEDDVGVASSAAPRPPMPPTDEIHRRVVEIWCTTLDLDDPGVLNDDSDFFDHGGDSLSALGMLTGAAGLCGDSDDRFHTVLREPGGPLTLDRVCGAVRAALG